MYATTTPHPQTPSRKLTALAAMLVALALGLALTASAPHPAFAEDDPAPDIATGQTAPLEETPGLQYSANVKDVGWTDTVADYAQVGTAESGTRIKNFKIALVKGSYTGGIRYREHLANGTWTAWKKNGKTAGAHNTIDAIQIELTGAIAESYDVVYRAYVSDVGWQRRMRNGESAGIEGGKKRIEALWIALVKKEERSGWVNEDGTRSYYENGAAMKGAWLDTDESPIDAALTGTHRYWLDADGALAVDRYVIPSSEPDAAASYTAFATDAGYLFCGKRVSSEGITFSDGQGKLRTATQWLKTSAYDGKTQRYRLQNVGAYAVAKTGSFKVSGKRYYAYPDDRGYLMRSTTRWVAGKWYKANGSGVLKNVNKKTKQHINRYVKWAVKVAKDNSHGYSQANRWGPDYDCSSLVVSALNAAGFPESGALWTGNMRKCLKKIGFKWHTDLSKLRRGDILLVHANYRQHTEIYIGNNKLVGAHSSENGGIYGEAGDQTGNEISVVRYYNAPWQGFLRYRS